MPHTPRHSARLVANAVVSLKNHPEISPDEMEALPQARSSSRPFSRPYDIPPTSGPYQQELRNTTFSPHLASGSATINITSDAMAYTAGRHPGGHSSPQHQTASVSTPHCPLGQLATSSPPLDQCPHPFIGALSAVVSTPSTPIYAPSNLPHLHTNPNPTRSRPSANLTLLTPHSSACVFQALPTPPSPVRQR